MTDSPEPVAPSRAVESALERAVRELALDRRSERNWRLFFRFAWFVLVAGSRPLRR